MQPVMSVADVREFESSLSEKGLSPQELMRRAGAVVAMQAARLVEGGGVVVLCGMGNNGGDGWVAADNLARHGYEVNVVAAATPALMKGDLARRMASRAAEMGLPVHVDPDFEELSGLLETADVVIDAVFGTGFSGAMPKPYDVWVRAVGESFHGQVVSVDVPSGISATTGMSEGAHFEADVTVTMFAAKPGLVSGEGREAAGEIVVASLAADDAGIADIGDAAAAFMLEDADYFGAVPEGDPLQDKYSRGRVLVVAGSSRYPGAAVLAALAASRSGAGYVTLAVPQPVVPIVQVQLPTVPVVGLPADEEGTFAVEAADRVGALATKADAVLAGPGMTTSFGACEVVRRLLDAPCPLVLDADALNAVVKACTGSAEAHPAPLRRARPLVLTPHRRELARLAGADPQSTSTLSGAMSAAQSLAWAVGSSDFCVVAKGPVSAVSTVDGTLIPEPGPAVLATAGTGDVLAGMVASLLAQALAGEDPEEGIDASDLVLLVAAADRAHAVAGELAERARGRGVIATDVAERAGLALDLLAARAERAFEESGEDAGSRLEGDLSFEDESRIMPPPELERLIRADKEAALPGAIGETGVELEEPTPSTSDAEAPALAAGEVSVQDGPEGAPGEDGPQVRLEEVPDVSEPSAAAEDLARPGREEPPAASGEEGGAATLPPFLARVYRDVIPAPADTGATTVMRPVLAEEAAQGEEGEDEASLQGDEPPVTPEERARRRLERFHEQATLRIDDPEATPVDERPSAKRPRVRRKR